MCHGYFHDHHAWKEHPLQGYKEKHDMIEYEERDQAGKNIEVEKLELEKNTWISLIFFFKDRRHKKCRRASRK